jgi:hypothetical protein
VDEPVQMQRRIRRRIDRDGLAADVVADVNIQIATGSASATGAQQIRQRKGRSTPAVRDPKTKEQP